jgi:GT2 family glycosyltransferase
VNPKVVVIVINYNGWKDTVECLESLRHTDYDNYETILLDNGSDDNSLEMIRCYCQGRLSVDSKLPFADGSTEPVKLFFSPADSIEGMNQEETKSDTSGNSRRLVVIRTEVNHGFVGGNNLAVQFALKHLSPDFVLLLNNDTIVHPHFLVALVRAGMSTHRVGLVQPKILSSDGLTIDNVGVILSPIGFLCPRGRGEIDSGQYDGLSESGFFFAAGTCLLIEREFLVRLGSDLFDDLLFAYNEDLDLSWNARMLGFRVLVCTSSICYHKGCRTSRSFGREKDLWMCRNTIRIFTKNYSIISVVVILPVFLIRYLADALFSTFRERDITPLQILFHSIVWNVALLKDTMKRRKYVQSIRTVGDREVMNFMAPFGESRLFHD